MATVKEAIDSVEAIYHDMFLSSAERIEMLYEIIGHIETLLMVLEDEEE